MPTLIGYWHCGDLHLGKEVGGCTVMISCRGFSESRHRGQQKILDSLHGHQISSPHFDHNVNHVGMSTELGYAIQRHVAKGSQPVVVFTIGRLDGNDATSQYSGHQR